MGKKRISSELTIMSLWPTLSDKGKRIIGDWIHSQRAKGDAKPTTRKPRSAESSILSPEYPPCEPGRNRGDLRDNPRNSEAAFAVQFHDTAVVLWLCAHAENREPFLRALAVLNRQIASYYESLK